MCVLALASRTALDTPWQRRGGRAIKVNGPVPLEARPGWFVQLPIIGGLNQPPRLRPAKEASQHFLNGRGHPSLSKEGTSAGRAIEKMMPKAPKLARPGWSVLDETSHLK